MPRGTDQPLGTFVGLHKNPIWVFGMSIFFHWVSNILNSLLLWARVVTVADLQIRGGASVWSNHKGGGLPGPSPGSAAEGSMQVTLLPTTTKQWLQARKM